MGGRVTFGVRLPFLLCSVVLRNLPWAPFDWFYVAT